MRTSPCQTSNGAGDLRERRFAGDWVTAGLWYSLPQSKALSIPQKDWSSAFRYGTLFPMIWAATGSHIPERIQALPSRSSAFYTLLVYRLYMV